MSATSKKGRKNNANYFLLYYVIKEFSGQKLIFDFEGSEVPSINFFFKKFGAIEQSYPFVRINRLPLWKRWLKKSMTTIKADPENFENNMLCLLAISGFD